MAEHLRENTDDRAVHAAYVRVLTDRVPYHGDGTRDWSRARPYTLAHLARLDRGRCSRQREAPCGPARQQVRADAGRSARRSQRVP
ncbi:hypothetical protein ACIPWI_37790 [Streptomyces sp. NPDC090046]|uniref:hypothetical protein n=1 Tax=Streptomyces sp. NPDC090046 TaxID=3365928 RepID=UPI0038063D07